VTTYLNLNEVNMALCQVSFFAEQIRKCSQMIVSVPDAGRGPFPVFYLLHGLSDDHTIWSRRTSIERYVAELPLLVVMPDGYRGFYSDAVNGPAYESYMLKDVIGFVDRVFPTLPRRSGRVIGGLSMGGYGALKLALKHPDLFCSAVSHSGALNAARRKWPEDKRDLTLIFGSNGKGGKDDLFTIAEQLDRETLPAIRFDCGTEDGLLADNRRFHRHLDRLGIPHEYEEFPGAHTWAYWDVHIQEALAFHRRALGI
jgi:putative tributyrin esterase